MAIFFFCFLKDSGGSKALSLGCLACTQRDLKMANVTPNYHSLEGRRLPLGLPESSTVKVLHLWSLLRAFLITWCISPWLHDLELLREVWTPGSDKITLKCKLEQGTPWICDRDSWSLWALMIRRVSVLNHGAPICLMNSVPFKQTLISKTLIGITPFGHL